MTAAECRVWREGGKRLHAVEETPGDAPIGLARSSLDELDGERWQLVTELLVAEQAAQECDLLGPIGFHTTDMQIVVGHANFARLDQ